MKKLVTILALFITISTFAEYQVFNYSASIKRIDPYLYTDGSTVTSDTLKGLLVTVCCYPCGAPMGKAYPNWLFIIRGKDKFKTVWKIPVKVDGGIFGKKIYAYNLDWDWTDLLIDSNWNYGLKKNLVKPADRSWGSIYFKSDMFMKVLYFDRKLTAVYDYGLLGYKCTDIEMTHTGFGNAGIKYNHNLNDFVNPYIKGISGSVTGSAKIPYFSFDPSNLTSYDIAPISGTFNIRFNNSLTEEIRGTADWNEIDRRIFKHLKFNQKMEAPDVDENWDLW